DVGDLRRHAVLAALEVDLPVQALGAAAAVARGLAAVRVAPTGLLEPLGKRLLGLVAGDLGEVGIGGEPAAGGRRLGVADGHYSAPSSPRKIGIVSPSRTWTMAFFQWRVRPEI